MCVCVCVYKRRRRYKSYILNGICGFEVLDTTARAWIDRNGLLTSSSTSKGPTAIEIKPCEQSIG